MDKVAIYARVSTVENQEYDRQINDLTAIIKQHGYKDNQIEIFAEKLSGYNKERPELARLMESANDFKCIYITEISRFGRNPRHTRKNIDDLMERKVNMYIQNIRQFTLNEDGSTNGIMSIILQVIMEFADLEAQTMKTRMKSGKHNAIKDGTISTSNLPFGYKNVDKKLVIDEDEAAIVRMMFNLSIEETGCDKIAHKLNSMNIPTRRSITLADKGYKLKGTQIKKDASTFKWGNVTVRQIIKNSIYYGKRKFSGEIYDSPPIISEELYIKANEAITNRTSKRDATYTYLMKNLMYCGECGKRYYGIYQIPTKASKVYKCTSNLRSTVCCNSTPNLSLIETVFYDLFLSNDLTKYIDNTNDIKVMLDKELEDLGNEIEILKQERNEKELAQNRLIKLYAKGTFNENELDNMNDEILNEIDALTNKLSLLKQKELEVKLSLSNFNDSKTSQEMMLDAKDNRIELRNFYKQLIHKVIVNKIDETYTLLTYYGKVKGVVLPIPLKIIINLKKQRKNPKTLNPRVYEYLPVYEFGNEPVFKDNILVSNIDEEIQDLIYWANQPQIELIDKPRFKSILKENWVYINESDVE